MNQLNPGTSLKPSSSSISGERPILLQAQILTYSQIPNKRVSTRLLDCNVELPALTRAKSSTLQPNKQVLVYQVVESNLQVEVAPPQLMLREFKCYIGCF